ncbi:MAG: TonB-dependent receptor [Bryobacterales bacterium]|nr:TonB-dependent receptor [Bryobacterales bacterium]
MEASSCGQTAEDGSPEQAADQSKIPPTRREVVIVTGTFDPVPLEESERAVDSLNVAESPLLYDTFTDYLKLLPALDLRQRGQNGIQGDLSIRGGSFGQTLILLDGVRMNDAQTGHHNLDLPLPLEAFESIEVLRGAGSTFYGADAVGGVVNFRTRRPEVSEIRLRGALGNFGSNQQRVTTSLVRGRFFEQLAASRDFSSGFIPNRDYRNGLISSVTHVETGLGFTRITLGAMDRPFGAQGFYGDYNSWERTKSWIAMASQELGPNTVASFSYHRHTDLFVLYRDRPAAYANHHISDTWLADFRRGDQIGASGRLNYGFETLHDGIVSTNLGAHDRSRQSVYVNYDLRTAGRFSASTGVRYELFGIWRGQVSPTASIGYWVSPHAKLRVSVSRAYRVPSFTDLYYHDPANIGNPDLQPERAVGYEAGLDWNASGGIDGEVTVFQRRERDGIDFVRASSADIWRARNFQRLRFTGAESTVRWRYRARGSVELAYAALHGAQSVLDGLQSRYVFNYPVQQVVATWQAVIPGNFAFRTRFGVTKRLQRPAYAVWDLAVAHNGSRVRPFVQFTNLGDSLYEEIPGVPLPGRGILGGVEVVLYTKRR